MTFQKAYDSDASHQPAFLKEQNVVVEQTRGGDWLS
jgi:hypothetical protein